MSIAPVAKGANKRQFCLPCPRFPPAAPPWYPKPVTAKNDKGVPVPRSLRLRVAFWKKIWGSTPDRLYSIADSRFPWISHAKVDCRDLFRNESDQSEKQCDKRILAVYRAITNVLRKQRRRPSRALVRKFGSRRFAQSAYKNLRVIKGHGDKLARAMKRAGSYLGSVEQIFAGVGVIPSLARMVVVESLGNPSVGSSKGAVGAYQFVATTARKYLRVDRLVDERYDPIRSGWAAAKYLRAMYYDFRSWPLTLTAYNTGPTRMSRLIKKLRTKDIGKIANAGNIGGFGFDGQNYYAQIVAVIQLTANTPIQAQAPGEAVRITKPKSLEIVSVCLQHDTSELVKLNPALRKTIVSDGLAVPTDYVMLLPNPEQRKSESVSFQNTSPDVLSSRTLQ